jgi:hypothetical protein
MKAARTIALSFALLGLAVPGFAEDGAGSSGVPSAVRAAISSALDVRQAELAGTQSQALSFFGWSVAAAGDTVVVGGPGGYTQGDDQGGQVYVFVKPASGWMNMVQTAELTPSDNGYASFGYSVAISNDIIAVGAPGVAETYLYAKPVGGWQNMTETAILQDGTGDLLDGFGDAVALDGPADTLAVTAEYSSVAAANGGAAYVFVKPAAGWQSTGKPNAALTPSDATADVNWGTCIAINSNTVVVGSAFQPLFINFGAVYVYVEPASGWTTMKKETAKLTESKQVLNAELGTSISLAGGTIVAGAPGPSPTSGKADIFIEPKGGWKSGTQNARLSAANTYEDAFGASVSLGGNMLAVGASAAEIGTAPFVGAVYLFVEPASGWKSTSNFNYEFTAEYGIQYDGLGYAVALDGNTLFAGAPFAYDLADVGAAYVFTF